MGSLQKPCYMRTCVVSFQCTKYTKVQSTASLLSALPLPAPPTSTPTSETFWIAATPFNGVSSGGGKWSGGTNGCFGGGEGRWERNQLWCPVSRTTKGLSSNRKVIFLLLTVWQEFEKMLAQYWPPSVREGEGSDSLSAPSISPWDPPRTMETLHGPPIHRRRRGYDRVDQNFLRLKECLGFVQFSPGKRKMDRNISLMTFVVNFNFEYFITAQKQAMPKRFGPHTHRGSLPQRITKYSVIITNYVIIQNETWWTNI